MTDGQFSAEIGIQKSLTLLQHKANGQGLILSQLHWQTRQNTKAKKEGEKQKEGKREREDLKVRKKDKTERDEKERESIGMCML